MVDSAVLAKSIGAVRDAVQRIREVLPDDVEQFEEFPPKEWVTKVIGSSQSGDA